MSRNEYMYMGDNEDSLRNIPPEEITQVSETAGPTRKY